jgi:hypothetical protein
MASARRLNVVNIYVRFLRNPSRGLRVTGRKRTKSYDLRSLSLTLTLKRAILNMASARRLNVLFICVRFLRNPSRGSRVTERKGNSHMTFDP